MGGVYYRTGYNWEQYDQRALQVRLGFESTPELVSIPNATFQLLGSKVFQRFFHDPGFLARYLSAEQAARVVQSTVPVVCLSQHRPQPGVAYVFKTLREGGGGLVDEPAQTSHSAIAMELVQPEPAQMALLTDEGVWRGHCLAEVGMFFGLGAVRVSSSYLVRVKKSTSKEGGVMMGASGLTSLQYEDP